MVNISSGLCWPLSKKKKKMVWSDNLHSKIIGKQEGIVSAGQDSMVCFGLLTDLMDSTGASESHLQEGKMQMEIQEDSVTLKKIYICINGSGMNNQQTKFGSGMDNQLLMSFSGRAQRSGT